MIRVFFLSLFFYSLSSTAFDFLGNPIESGWYAMNAGEVVDFFEAKQEQLADPECHKKAYINYLKSNEGLLRLSSGHIVTSSGMDPVEKTAQVKIKISYTVEIENKKMGTGAKEIGLCTLKY